MVPGWAKAERPENKRTAKCCLIMPPLHYSGRMPRMAGLCHLEGTGINFLLKSHHTSPLFPFLGDFLHRLLWVSRIYPKDLHRTGSAHLHLQTAAYGGKFQVLLAGADGSDDSQGNFGHMRRVSGGFNGGNRTGNDGGMASVE